MCYIKYNIKLIDQTVSFITNVGQNSQYSALEGSGHFVHLYFVHWTTEIPHSGRMPQLVRPWSTHPEMPVATT